MSFKMHEIVILKTEKVQARVIQPPSKSGWISLVRLEGPLKNKGVQVPVTNVEACHEQ